MNPVKCFAWTPKWSSFGVCFAVVVVAAVLLLLLSLLGVNLTEEKLPSVCISGEWCVLHQIVLERVTKGN